MNIRTLFLFLIVSLGGWAQNGLAGPSGNYRLLELESADLRYQKFLGQRDPYIPQYDGAWDYRVALDWRLSSMRYLFWDNSVHAEALQDGRVKSVGWHWLLGLRIPKLNVDLFHEHHSRHIFDEQPLQRDGTLLPEGYRKFPVEDLVGIRFRLYGDGAK